MFSTSTQLKYWTFSGNSEVHRLRNEAHQKYVSCNGSGINDDQKYEFFLTFEEELKVVKHYEYVLKDFCTHFQPPMPRYVIGTSIVFLKRYFLHNSVMDYHPKDILYTCVYLACKVEEFNVSIQQFVGNMHGDQDQASDLLLSQELLLMQQLHYHLTIHNPYRPLEGLLIDIKTRLPEVDDPEKLRQGADTFLDRVLHTDVPLIFAPSQIALAGLLSSGGKCDINLDSYVAQKLLSSGGKEALQKTSEHIKKIRTMVRNVPQLNRDEVRAIEQKLEGCRNQENNPASEEYAKKMEELWDDEGERQHKKYMKIAKDEKVWTKDLLS